MVGIGWLGTMAGAHMCSVPLYGTEKSLWEHYNELAAKLDAKQEAVWHDIANSTLLFVRLPRSLYIMSLVTKVQVVRSLCGCPFDISRRRPPKDSA